MSDEPRFYPAPADDLMGRTEAYRVSLHSSSPEATGEIGRIIGECAEAGTCIALDGPLGAGKTCLTQGIARGLGVGTEHYITSPTFTLVNEYPGRLSLYHMDAYRLGSPAELDDLGYGEFFSGDGVVVVEWAEKIESALPEGTVHIAIVHAGETERTITLTGTSTVIKCVETKSKGGSS